MTDRSEAGNDGSEGDRTYSVNELADEAGVTRRTVHYYIAQGLLPASGSEGRGSRYGQGHLDRLRLIRQLQREHLPLAEIRRRLDGLTDAQVADLTAIGEHLAPPRSAAFDYIQSVLAGTNTRAMPLPVAPPRPALHAPAAPAGVPQPKVTAARFAPVAPAPAVAPPQPASGHAIGETRVAYDAGTAVTRSQWERIALAPDIELHVRRPLSRLQNKAVERIVGLARQLLEEDQQ